MRNSLVFQAIGALLAATTNAKSIVHETAPSPIPQGWKDVGSPSPSTPLSLSIALQQPGLQELRARLDAVSHPAHPQYGEHLSRSLLKRYQAVPEAHVDAVIAWLGASGVPEDQVAIEENAWVRFNATVEQVEALLDCQIRRYQAQTTSGLVDAYRARQYSLPEEMVDLVDYVYPVTQFMSTTSKKRSVAGFQKSLRTRQAAKLETRGDMPASCSSYINPDCVVDLYNMTYVPPDKASNSRIAIAGFLEQYPSLNYIHSFLDALSPRRNTTANYTSANYNYTVESLNGGLAESEGTGGGEAMLDTAYIMPFVEPLDVVYYSTGGRGPYIDENGHHLTANDTATSPNEPWVEFLEELLVKEDDTLPQVLSISYTDTEQTIPRPYATKVCSLFMQLGARGVSVLVASGDGGAAGTGGYTCVANDGLRNTTKFLPTFPADCPYVTSVGATDDYSTTVGAYFSSGGFSDYFARPSWQDAAVAGYIDAMGEGAHAGWYNASGRAIPDIAAVGSHIQIMPGGGRYSTTSGTSASTPIVASMVALVNDVRLRAGKPVLGFLNPLLYSEDLAGVFVDAVEGSGGSCSYGDGQFESGWEVLPGWDAVTGLGTVNFGKLLEILG